MAKPYKSVLTRHQLQQLATQFRSQVESWLEPRLPAYLDAVGEAFLQQADQAPGDAHRHGFHAAVRELARKRDQIAGQFRANLLKATENFFLHYEAYLEEFIHGFAPSTAPARSLELVNNEKLEEDLVILRNAHRATSRHQARHKEMVSYMAAVVQPKDLPQNGTPLSPQVIAGCLRMALSGWEGEPATRYLFYQQLAEKLLADIDRLYPPLVETLRRMGLEPVPVQVRIRRFGERPARVLPRHPATLGATERPDNEEGALFTLLGLMRQLDEEDRQALGLIGALLGGETGEGGAMKPEQLAGLIRRIQHAHPPLVEGLEQARAFQQAWKHELVRTLQEEAARNRLRIHNLDQQIIDVVTMLFDFVLDDELMPDSMKVLLVRLQMPVLQVAIRDKTFLTNSRHPVRVLINNLSRAAVRWVDTGDYSEDSVYGMIRRSVERILAGDNLDLELYIEVNREFMEFVAQEERGARVAEERVSQVARGKEQLAVARRRVAEILDALVTDDLPEVVRQILEDAWRDVLTLVLLREGEESEAWEEALRVARRLAHGVWALENREERQRFLEEVPRLLGDLRRGFASIAYDSRKAGQLLEQLEACHRAAVEQERSPVACTRPPAGELRARPAEPAEPDHFDRLVQALREGDWVRWQLPGEGERRGKLAWRSEIADILLFVDMRGRKLAEHSSAELAELFRRGQASRLEHIDRPFMERAFQYLRRLIGSRVSREQPRILPA